MAEKQLKTLTFPGLSTTYVIPEVDSTLTVSGDAADAKVVGDHVKDTSNPHGVTYSQVGAAPAEIISGAIQPSTVGQLDTDLKAAYNAMGINTRKYMYANMTFTDGLSGGIWQITLAKTTDAYGFIIAECYTSAPSPLVKTRTIYGGAWGDWYDSSASTFALVSHSQAASTITGGTFAGPVYASNTAQAPITSQLRNSRIDSLETTPSNNGEICWVYE